MASFLKNLSSIGHNKNVTCLTSSSKNVFNDVKGSTRNVNLRTLKDRMGGITTVKKISQVMKVLTQQKSKQVQLALMQSRPAITGPNRIWGDLNINFQGKRNLFVVISSDKGMCGGINAQTTRFVRDLLRQRVQNYKIIPSIISLGELSSKPLARLFPEEINWHASQFSKFGATFPVASYLAEKILKSNAEIMTLVFNTYINTISYELTTREFLLPASLEENRGYFNTFEFAEDSSTEHMNDLHEFSLASILYQAMVENNASENAARLLAMDGASKNAGDLSKLIERQYNKARQAKITLELLEIVSAATFTSKK